tara:strand:- start:15008 stop:15826 length:819 start_codon:yes stop_codon:yes gene_type:complete
MKNKSVSDFVAASMDAVLKSKEHKSLFGTQYKFASSEECKEHGKVDDCDADTAFEVPDEKGNFPFNPAKDLFKGYNSSVAPSSSTPDWSAPSSATPRPTGPSAKDYTKVDDAKAEDDTIVMPQVDDYDDLPRHPEAEPEMTSTAFDIAIDSLLTASAALDSVGMPKSSSLSLKLASLVVEAKKKDVKDKKDPEAAKAAKAKEKAKLQAEKEKAKEKADKEKAKLEAAKKKEKEAKDTQMAKDKSAKDKAKEKAEKDKLKEKADKLKALEKKK